MSLALIAGAAQTASSWLRAGAAGTWYPEVGTLLNDSCEGGILESLEIETGKEYPHLRALRQECVNKWRDYQRAMPWAKEAAEGVYQSAVETFAASVESEQSKGLDILSGAGLAGVVDTIKKPYMLIGMVVAVVLVIIMVVIKR